MSHGFFQKYFPANISYRTFIFIPLFFSFYIVLKVFNLSSIVLQNFDQRSISIATAEGIDIGQRVSLFYKASAFVLFLLIFLTRLTIIVRRFIPEEELKLMNGISLGGFCLLFFQLVGADMGPSMHVIFSLLLICLSGSIFHKIKKREEKDFTAAFLWSVLISTAIFFLQWQIMQYLTGRTILSLPAVLDIAGIPLYVYLTSQARLTSRVLRLSRPIIYIPLLSFLAPEVYLILNQRGIFISPSAVYSAGIILILIICFAKSRNKKIIHSNKPILDTLFEKWVPWLLLGIFCFSFYTPIVTPEIDMFETANNILPLQQWYSYGKVPFLETFNSHTLSDFSFGWLYSIFNGNDPMGVFVYRFLLGVIVILVTYHFIYKITADGFLALWITIGYPYTELFLPSYFNLIPLAALSFIMLYEKQSVRRYVFFFCSILFMIVWRIDLGSSTLIASAGSFAFLVFFIPSFKINGPHLLKGLSLSVLMVLIIFLIAIAHSGSHLFVSMKDALAYLSSFQSYGIKDLAPVHDLEYFSLYYIFPAVILMLVIYCIFNITKERFTGNYILYAIAVVFLGLFYFSNVQRGLVRHTLFEHWNNALTSYGFFIISSFIYLSMRNRNSNSRFLYFFIASTVLISNYVFAAPDLKTNNNYNYFALRVFDPPKIKLSYDKVKRINEEASFQVNYREFEDWSGKNITGNSTFLDFSNTPMLYYYSGKILPSYLVQIPHTAHNEYLQKRFIEDLKNYDLPYTVFSNVPGNFWDNLDGIPNTLRHYRICEYIYRNYKPALIVNSHSIWIKKDKAQPAENEILSVNPADFRMNGVTITENKLLSVSGEHGYVDCAFKTPLAYSGKRIYATMQFTSDRNMEIVFNYKSASGSFNDKQKSTFKIHSGTNQLFMMPEPLNNENDINEILFTIPQGVQFNISDFKFYSGDYYRDYYSTQPANYSLKWIPYIWGSFDKNYKSGGIVKEKDVFSGKQMIEPNVETHLNFAPVFDKENGDYIKITARTIDLKDNEVVLSYGKENERSGSFTFSLKNDSTYHDYLVRVSSQYGWYSKDNSWMRIRPVGSAVEIKSAEILKGD